MPRDEARYLTMAITARDLAPRIQIDNGQLLPSPRRKRVVKLGHICACLLPLARGIAEEHAEQVARAAGASWGVVGGARVHDAQVVDELDVAVLAVELDAVLLGEVLDGGEGVHLRGREGGHAGVAGDMRAAEERSFDELHDGLAFGEEEGGAGLEVGRAVSGRVLWSVYGVGMVKVATHFCFSSKGQLGSAMVSKTVGSVSSSSLYIFQKEAKNCSPPAVAPPSSRTWRARISPEKRSLWKSMADVSFDPARPMCSAPFGTLSWVASRIWPEVGVSVCS
jgi:hypothetical protein